MTHLRHSFSSLNDSCLVTNAVSVTFECTLYKLTTWNTCCIKPKFYGSSFLIASSSYKDVGCVYGSTTGSAACLSVLSCRSTNSTSTTWCKHVSDTHCNMLRWDGLKVTSILVASLSTRLTQPIFSWHASNIHMTYATRILHRNCSHDSGHWRLKVCVRHNK